MSVSLRLVMMGTGTFALPTFRALIESEHTVVGLFTQPDRAGRGHHRHPHPMKELAIEHGIPVYQPDRINQSEAVSQLQDLQSDLSVVAAYGQILSAEVIQSPRYGSINLHASLLPKYRGAAPVQYAIWKGESETGVTIFQIEPRLDAGAILGVVRTGIEPDETSGTLADRLSQLAVPLTLEVVGQIEAGVTRPQSQEPSSVTKAPRLEKSDGVIDWSETARQIDCRVRAMQPWPKASTWLLQPSGATRLIVLQVGLDRPVPLPDQVDPGTVLHCDSQECVVATGDRPVRLLRVQPEGKRPMPIGDFLRGYSLRAGDRLVNCPPTDVV